ncbi:MAG: hypothetical protein KAJ19_17305 [Gammaproteobacteria bacterium]|nr:hypothetical protein [Gammaproteobacteria bacterium]
MNKTGEYTHVTTLLPEMAEVQGAVDHMMKRLRYEIGIKMEEVLRAHGGKEVVLSVEETSADPVPYIRPYPYPPDIENRVEYRMKFTAVLLRWQDAEIGDCVHASSIVPYRSEQVETVMQDSNKRASFIWEGRWWRRTE